jgi:type VI secretion system VasD/TssJ family lipoprotein
MTRLLLAALLLACKPPPPCTPPDAPVVVQLLAAAGSAPNIDDDGTSWPVNLRIYELAHPPTAELDLPQLLKDPAAALGDAPAAIHERTAFPGHTYQWPLELAADTTHVLVAGLFRRPVGDAWYLLFAVPERPADRCDDPCMYLGLDRGEAAGGRFPPPDFPIAEFSLTCAPIAVTKGAPR